MGFFVKKTYGTDRGFSSVFRQPRATSQTSRLHGYALGFSFLIEADELDENNWVYDFGKMKAVESFLKTTFDHKLLVAATDPHLDEIAALQGFGIADVIVLPSVGCEAFALHAFEYASARIDHDTKGRAKLTNVECFEHGSNMAGYKYNG